MSYILEINGILRTKKIYSTEKLALKGLDFWKNYYKKVGLKINTFSVRRYVSDSTIFRIYK